MSNGLSLIFFKIWVKREVRDYPRFQVSTHFCEPHIRTRRIWGDPTPIYLYICAAVAKLLKRSTTVNLMTNGGWKQLAAKVSLQRRTLNDYHDEGDGATLFRCITSYAHAYTCVLHMIK